MVETKFFFLNDKKKNYKQDLV